MSKPLNKVLTIAVSALAPLTSYALPIDWQGSFGVDSSIISDFRRVNSTENRTQANDGSQELPVAAGNKDSLSFQSYVFKLAPSIIINDAATFKAELTNGYSNGGFAGEAAQSDANGTTIPGLYYHNQAEGKEIHIRKAYLELYSDTATYILGRHTTHWGLGAIYNSGDNVWDRHASSRDGVTMKLKLGNFNLSPFWSKVDNKDFSSATDTTEYGAGVLYDNQEKDIAFGINYSKKKSKGGSTTYKTDSTSTPQVLGETDLTVTDLYFKKTWGDFDLAVELPLFSGKIGNANANAQQASASTKAIIVESNYRRSDSWNFNLKGGTVNGHDGSSKFGALYLNPNYQVANLLFRYNLVNGAAGNKAGIYDSYITNAMYIRLGSTYTSEKWIFDTAVIYAKANETAEADKSAYNHTKNKIFTAKANQESDLGTEIDINATYKWNNEINIGLGLGYLLTGDYFAFTNDPAIVEETKNTFIVQFNTSVKF